MKSQINSSTKEIFTEELDRFDDNIRKTCKEACETNDADDFCERLLVLNALIIARSSILSAMNNYLKK